MFRGIVWIPPETRIPFIRLRMLFFAISGLVVGASLLLLVGRGLEYGIDFTGGILVEAKFPTVADIAATRAKMDSHNLGSVE
ncbi:MAG: protein translocase subunit SecF, partial [Pseudomonadota bacterium]